MPISAVPPKIITPWPSNPIKIKLHYIIVLIITTTYLFKYIPRTAENPFLFEGTIPVAFYTIEINYLYLNLVQR